MYILKTGSWEHVGTPDVRAMHQELAGCTKERFRQAGPLTCAAILGACKCTGGSVQDPFSGVFITTESGSLSDTLPAIDVIYGSHQLPKPFHFVGTLQNTMGWYVAKVLGTQGSQQTLSGGVNSEFRIIDIAEDRKAACLGSVNEAHLVDGNRVSHVVQSHWLQISSSQKDAVAVIESCIVKSSEDIAKISGHETNVYATEPISGVSDYRLLSATNSLFKTIVEIVQSRNAAIFIEPSAGFYRLYHCKPTPEQS